MDVSTELLDVCCVCSDEPDEENPLVYCDGEGCQVAIHPDCHGYPLSKSIPEGEWFCDRCLAREPDAVCALCGKTGGAMKRTTDWRWAHLLCAMWVPEAFFRNPDGSDAIDVLRIPKFRWELVCSICDRNVGACVECSDANCSRSFHVTCASDEDLWLQYKSVKNGPDVVFGLCAQHTKKWRHQCKIKGISDERGCV